MGLWAEWGHGVQAPLLNPYPSGEHLTPTWGSSGVSALPGISLSASCIWPGVFHGQRSLVGYSPWGRKELDTAEQLTLIFAHPPPPPRPQLSAFMGTSLLGPLAPSMGCVPGPCSVSARPTPLCPRLMGICTAEPTPPPRPPLLRRQEQPRACVPQGRLPHTAEGSVRCCPWMSVCHGCQVDC